MTSGEVRALVNQRISSCDWEDIPTILNENIDAIISDTDLLAMAGMCLIAELERDHGLPVVFTKARTVEECYSRYRRIKFLLWRIDFGTLDAASELFDLVEELQVDSVELQFLIYKNCYHKEEVRTLLFGEES